MGHLLLFYTLALCCALPASAGDFLPLRPGNAWVYVHQGTDINQRGNSVHDTLRIAEEGVGVIRTLRAGVISPARWETRLIWAVIDGREYGHLPTVTTARSWGQLKTDPSP